MHYTQRMRQMSDKQHPTISTIQDTYAAVKWHQLAQPVHWDAPSQTVTLSYPHTYHQAVLAQQLHQQLDGSSPTSQIKIKTDIAKHQPQGLLQPLKKIKNIIAIHANKGGVGKSTLATNIAAAVANTGCRVGLLDGDLYGPNQPALIGYHDKTEISEEQYKPIHRHGIHMMSMGFLIDKTTPLVWRGPMASGYFQQMVFKTDWPELDYLFIDCPPGTGDILLTMAQKVPISGVILITTPQCLSVNDCMKGVAMLNKMQLPILGFIENMASYQCQHCHQDNQIFPTGQAKAQLLQENINYLGSVPLHQNLIQSAENGQPWLSQHHEDSLSKTIQRIAIRTCSALAQRPLAKPNIYSTAPKD